MKFRFTSGPCLADQGNGEPLFNMGIMTRDGLGVPADAGVGLDWMRKAADAGYGQAYLDFGAAYVNGIDTIGDRLAPFNSRRIDPEITFGCEYQFA